MAPRKIERDFAFRFGASQFATGNARAPVAPRGKIFSEPPNGNCLGYFGYVPESIHVNRPPLVTVHGISRNAGEHIFQFCSFADRYGVAVIAPHFPRSSHRWFQRLKENDEGVAADAAFDLTLNTAEDTFGLSFAKFRIFGHSAGGQYVHRYLMAHPDRADRASLFAPGWYSLPTNDHKFPYGIGGEKSPVKSLDRFLNVFVQVLVGERDRARDASLRKSRKLDSTQGGDRVERANTWVQAMRQAAIDAGQPPRVLLNTIADAGHSFGANCKHFRLRELVMEHLYGATKSDVRNNNGDENG